MASPNGQLPSDSRSAAAYYLDRGYVPVPIPRIGHCKAPTLQGWQALNANAVDLDRLFPADQALNIGLLLGAPSGGLIDIDLDAPEAVAAARWLLPPTGWVSGRASKPRSHWWYVVPDPPGKAQDAYQHLDGTMLLEVRSTSGQTVVPPSVHESGEAVTWHTFNQPAQIDFATLLTAVRKVAAVALLARHWPARGARHHARLALSGALALDGWNTEPITQFVLAVTTVAGNEDLRDATRVGPDSHRRRTEGRTTWGWTKLAELLGPNGQAVVRRARQWLQSAPAPAKASQRGIRTLEPYQTFPVAVLPAPLQAFVCAVAQALGCDPAYVALPVLAVIASTIGNTRTIRLKRGWEEPSIVWSAIVGDSGTLKSPAYFKAVRYLFVIQKRLHDEFRAAKKQYEQELADWLAAKRRKDSDPGEQPEEPVLRRVVCSDTTIEKLAEILEDNARGVPTIRDELASWLGGFFRYKGKQGGSDLPAWMEMHRAGTLIVDRKTGERKHYFIPRASVSVTGGIQPGVLANALTQEFLDAGLAARLLMAMPPKLPKRWSDAEVAEEVETAYHKLIDKLLALEFDCTEEGPVPHVLPLSRAAKAAWVAFYNNWAQEQAAVEGELAAAFSKLEGYAARFALLHHVVTCIWLEVDDRREVGVQSIEAGATLCFWFAREARRIYTTLSESVDERANRRLVEFIQARGGQVTATQLQRSNSRKYPTAEMATLALDGLVATGYGHWIDRPGDRRGGRPTRDFVLHPTVAPTTDDTDDTSSEEEEGNGGLPTRPPDITPPPSDETRRIPEETEVSSVSSVVGTSFEAVPTAAAAGKLSAGGFVGRNGVSSDSTVRHCLPGGPALGASVSPSLLVQDRTGLESVARALADNTLVAVDCETTGLDPRRDRLRLLSLSCVTVDGGTFVYLVDCFAVDPSPLRKALTSKELVLHHAAFDLAFLARLGFTPTGTIHDTLLMARLLEAGGPHFHHCSLADCCGRYLNRPLDKTEQRSDWSRSLTTDQLIYAARDVEVLVPLYQHLHAKLAKAKLEEVLRIEERAVPAFVWLAGAGVPFNGSAWDALAEEARQEAESLATRLDEAAPVQNGYLGIGGSWDWDSPHQVKAAFAAIGISLESTDDDHLAAVNHPVAELLRQYRAAQKRWSTYGTDWSRYAAADGRIYPHWNQLGSVAGRTSCSEPNLQQVPRDPRYRRCFRAPAGRVLIKADYSQLQLRIAAKIANEQKMLEAYACGEDLHTLTARQLTGKRDVGKADRQLAKAVNFGLLFGLGAKGLRAYAKSNYGLDLSEEEAARYRAAFFNAYPGLASWHRREGQSRKRECRTLAGRRRLLDEKTPYTHRLNSPVQGTEADGMKLALALLWERRCEAPSAVPVLLVHDELVIECDEAEAEVAAPWLQTAMIDGMAPFLDPVPIQVEVKVAQTWGKD
jgi:DNA polymerase I-like protein with 3'-5' exonuclease and polymerase domains